MRLVVRSTRTRLAFAIVLLVAPVFPVGAQSEAVVTPPPRLDSVQFRGLNWRSIGPNRGGRSIAVAGSAARPLEYFFGAVGGGVW
jgi:hypothetical protein